MAGFTITGGVSFSGAVSMSDPVVENTAAWFGGGYNGDIFSRVDRITFATDTATATTRGPLSTTRKFLTATGMYSDGWFGGGQDGAGGAGNARSTVDRITYATDTATAVARGPLSLARYSLAAASNLTDAWFGGGYAPSTNRSTVDRITFATDTATASGRGPLSLARSALAAAGNTTDGWFGGGIPGSPYLSIVDRITYATDTATASVRGPLSQARTGLGATGNSQYGWFAGGFDGNYPFAYRSTVDRITYANDTATASVRGPLNLYQGGKVAMGAAGNTYDGWFGGGAGYNGSLVYTYLSLVDRITYATDTATASTRGPLSLARNGIGAAGGLQ